VIRPLDDMRRRVELARLDSDVTHFYDLIALGELVIKLVAVGTAARIDDESARRRHVVALAAADGLGQWSATVGELTSKASVAGAWAASAHAALIEASWLMDAVVLDLPAKPSVASWAAQFVALRNRTRGHGAPPAARCRAGSAPLERSIGHLVDGLPLFGKPWVAAEGSVYIDSGQRRLVPLVLGARDLSDLWIANGGYDKATGEYQLLSYLTDTRRTARIVDPHPLRRAIEALLRDERVAQRLDAGGLSLSELGHHLKAADQHPNSGNFTTAVTAALEGTPYQVAPGRAGQRRVVRRA
jgi:hypothetical protein